MMYVPPQRPLGAECPPCNCANGQEQDFLQKYEIVPSVVTGVIVAVVTGVVLYQLQRYGVKTA